MIVLIPATISMSLSCSRSGQEADPPLARVEKSTIRLSDLDEGTRANYLSLGEAAEHWIDDQVLLQHAEGSKLINQRAVTKQLQKHEQRLLAGLLLDSLLLNQIQIDPEEVRAYYANHIEEFQFPFNAALVTHICFRRRDAALEALDLLGSSVATRDSVLGQYNFDHQLIYQNQIIPSLDEAVFQARVTQFYGPITSDFGYHIILVERFFDQGDTIPFIFVRKHIYEKLFQMRLPLERLTIIDSLREMLDVEVYHD
ncbi:MAG: peptidyl-prolyl cis-trans isomerase [Candidatus Neomarinimicrobiota bacterium]